MSIDDLGSKIKGKGRALTTWDRYKVGLDPIYFFGTESYGGDEVWDHAVRELIQQSTFEFQNVCFDDWASHSDNNNSIGGMNRRDDIIDRYMPVKRRQIHITEKGMGAGALNELSNLYPNSLGIEYSIASLEMIQQATDGTIKLLLKLKNRRNSKIYKGVSTNSHKPEQDYFIESVIIPWYDRSNPTSTLCV